MVPNPRFPKARITYAVRDDTEPLPAPSAFTLDVPVVEPSGIDNVATFTWSASFRTVYYKIQLALEAGFSSILYDAVLDPGLTTQIFFSAGSPTQYARIVAVNDNGTQVSNVQPFDPVL